GLGPQPWARPRLVGRDARPTKPAERLGDLSGRNRSVASRFWARAEGRQPHDFVYRSAGRDHDRPRPRPTRFIAQWSHRRAAMQEASGFLFALAATASSLRRVTHAALATPIVQV